MCDVYQRQQAESAEQVRRYRLAIRRIDAMLIATGAFLMGAGAMLFILSCFFPNR